MAQVKLAKLMPILQQLIPHMQPTDIGKVKALLAQVDLESLEQEIRRGIRWEMWRPGMAAPTGVLWEDAYPELKQGDRLAYVLYMGGTIRFELFSAVNGQPLRTEEDVRASVQAQIEEYVQQELTRRAAEEIVELW